MPGETASPDLMTIQTDSTPLENQLFGAEVIVDPIDHAREVFISQGLLSRGDNGEWIFHLDNWQQPLGFAGWKKDLGQAAYGPKGHPSLLHTLRQSMSDIQGYSPEDYQRLKSGEEIPPKLLLSWPVSHDVLRDPTFTQDAYFSLDDLHESVKWQTVQALDGSLVGKLQYRFAEWFHQKNISSSGMRAREVLLSRLAEGASFEQTLGLMHLHEAELVSFGPQGEVECDLDKLKTANWSDSGLLGNLSQIYESSGGAINNKKGDVKIADYLLQLFDGLEVYDKRHAADQGYTEPQPLFILPPDKNTRLSAAEVKSWRGWLGMWEVSRGNVPIAYPSLTDGFASPLSFPEVRAAILLWHEQYGAGERDSQTGTLQLRYKDGNTKRKPSWEFFKSWGFSAFAGDIITHHPWQWLEQHAGSLIQPDGIHEGDFAVIAGHNADNRRIERRPNSEKGMYSLNGVRYTLGTEYGKPSNRVIELEKNKLAAVVEDGEEGRRIVKCIFRLKDPATFSQGEYRSVNKNQIDLVPINDWIGGQQELDDMIENFEDFLNFSKRLQTNYGIKYYSMPYPEQVMGYQVSREFGKNEQFWRYIEKNGEPGLKAFMLACNSLQDVQKTLDIGSMDGSTLLLTNVEMIVDLVSGKQQLLDNEQLNLMEDEVSRCKDLNQAALTMTAELFFSSHGKSSDVLNQINHALFRHYRLLERTYRQQFDQGSSSFFQRLMQTADQSESRELQHVFLNLIQEELLQEITSLQPAHNPHEAEKALTEAIFFFNQHPDLLMNSEQLAIGDHRLVYRLLARSNMSIPEQNKVICSLLRFNSLADEIETMHTLIGDQHLPKTEKSQIEQLLARIMGIVGKKVHVDLADFYHDVRYDTNLSNTSSQETRRQILDETAQSLHLNKQTARIRDLGSGTGEDVAHWHTMGYADVQGVEYSSEQVQQSLEKYGSYFKQGSWYTVADDPDFQQCDLVTCVTRTDGHANGPNQRRTFISNIAQMLKNGGHALIETANAEHQGSDYLHRIEAYRSVLRELDMPEEQVQEQYYIVDSPDGKNYSFRFFPPVSWYIKEFEKHNLMLISEEYPPMPHLEKDQNAVLLLKKK